MMSLGWVVAAIPFIFAALRAISSGTDFRFAWVALAAAVAAWTALGYRDRNAPPGTTRFFIALIASTVAASVTGFALGARSVPAVLVVAIGFAICEAGGLTLVYRARTQGSREA
jgi:hypothetical protein